MHHRLSSRSGVLHQHAVFGSVYAFRRFTLRIDDFRTEMGCPKLAMAQTNTPLL
jgi:hypothetical protein